MSPVYGLEARVYWNLHRGLWSVQQRTPDGWRVVGRLPSFRLDGATFKVSQAGRARVLETGVKNVHAMVHGTLRRVDIAGTANAVAVTYNPFRAGWFHLKGQPEQRVDVADTAYFWADRQVTALAPSPTSAALAG